jgi:hypothetical protein
MRPNSYEENKASWQIAQEKNLNLSDKIAKIPLVFLDKVTR